MCVCYCTGALSGELALGCAFRLLPGKAIVNMDTPIIVKSGDAVFLNSGGRTLKTRSFGFEVEANATLCLYHINQIDGMESAIKLGKPQKQAVPVPGAELPPQVPQANGAVVDVGWVTISSMN